MGVRMAQLRGTVAAAVLEAQGPVVHGGLFGRPLSVPGLGGLLGGRRISEAVRVLQGWYQVPAGWKALQQQAWQRRQGWPRASLVEQHRALWPGVRGGQLAQATTAAVMSGLGLHADGRISAPPPIDVIAAGGRPAVAIVGGPRPLGSTVAPEGVPAGVSGGDLGSLSSALTPNEGTAPPLSSEDVAHTLASMSSSSQSGHRDDRSLAGSIGMPGLEGPRGESAQADGSYLVDGNVSSGSTPGFSAPQDCLAFPPSSWSSDSGRGSPASRGRPADASGSGGGNTSNTSSGGLRDSSASADGSSLPRGGSSARANDVEGSVSEEGHTRGGVEYDPAFLQGGLSSGESDSDRLLTNKAQPPSPRDRQSTGILEGLHDPAPGTNGVLNGASPPSALDREIQQEVGVWPRDHPWLRRRQAATEPASLRRVRFMAPVAAPALGVKRLRDALDGPYDGVPTGTKRRKTRTTSRWGEDGGYGATGDEQGFDYSAGVDGGSEGYGGTAGNLTGGSSQTAGDRQATPVDMELRESMPIGVGVADRGVLGSRQSGGSLGPSAAWSSDSSGSALGQQGRRRGQGGRGAPSSGGDTPGSYAGPRLGSSQAGWAGLSGNAARQPVLRSSAMSQPGGGYQALYRGYGQSVAEYLGGSGEQRFEALLPQSAERQWAIGMPVTGGAGPSTPGAASGSQRASAAGLGAHLRGGIQSSLGSRGNSAVARTAGSAGFHRRLDPGSQAPSSGDASLHTSASASVSTRWAGQGPQQSGSGMQGPLPGEDVVGRATRQVLLAGAAAGAQGQAAGTNRPRSGVFSVAGSDGKLGYASAGGGSTLTAAGDAPGHGVSDGSSRSSQADAAMAVESLAAALRDTLGADVAATLARQLAERGDAPGTAAPSVGAARQGGAVSRAGDAENSEGAGPIAPSVTSTLNLAIGGSNGAPVDGGADRDGRN